MDKDSYTHISPEYWITDGLRNKPGNYKVFKGLKNYEGNANYSLATFNIVAHIQYYQTNIVKVWIDKLNIAKLTLLKYTYVFPCLPMNLTSIIDIGYPPQVQNDRSPIHPLTSRRRLSSWCNVVFGLLG
jgi:hypothetical protein